LNCFKSAFSKIFVKKEIDFLAIFENIRSKNSFILQSGLSGQYSIIGFDPIKILKFQIPSTKYSAFLTKLEDEAKKYQLNLNIPFTGGAIGFFSYDFGVALQGISQTVKDDIKIPLAYFIIPSKIIVFDHKNNELIIIAWAKKKEAAERNIMKLKNMISKRHRTGVLLYAHTMPSIKSNLTKSVYFQKIQKIKKLLTAGETYQVNFSQRFKFKSVKDPFEIYKKVSKINPSPYQLYLEAENFSVISNSPERLFKIEKINRIQSRPIKGTRPRGKTKKEDQFLIKELLNSQKEQAELDMITDLVRNDLGKICVKGTVEVNENRVVESYSHVHHTMSNVQGILQENIKLIDIIKALFPGGSITGCPKYRTIKIIDKLEDFKRHIYCGSAGYIDGRGNMDFNIMIRTILSVIHDFYFHSGGGIVYDSDPISEYEETRHKAEALMKAIL